MTASPEIGSKFTLLTVVSAQFRGDDGRLRVRCKCECGQEIELPTRYLSSGNNKSCGCLKRRSRPGPKTHGLTHGREWKSYYGMLDRCYKPDCGAYARYGGRGIRVCERWKSSFEVFYADMGPRPEGMTLDRVDNNGNYEPGNCVWASARTQANNRSNNRLIKHGSEELTLSEWARRAGISPAALGGRLKKGWPVGRAISEPLLPRNLRIRGFREALAL